MKRTKMFFTSALSFVVVFLLAFPAGAQIEIGNAVISGEAEVGGMPRGTNGARQKFEEYRDLSETAIVPQLQLMIGGKKDEFYLNFDSSNLGRDNQNYIMRGGTYTLGTKPADTAGGTTCATNAVCQWLNSEANGVDLKMFNGFGKFKVRYTPGTNWTFTGGYSSQNVAGRRAIGAYFGSRGGTNKVTELGEPLDYQIHNIDLGGEYAGNGWSLGLRYNASLFHNNTSTLVWDNPTNLSGTGAACTDAAGFSNTSTGTDANRGPCRGRMDLYPSNQAHTWTLSGATKLPLKSHFMGTVSYGVRLQNDPFLPQTSNSALASRSVSRESLDGDVRPTIVNATLVNRYFDRLNLKAYYRLYDFDNRSKQLFLPDGYIRTDTGPSASAAAEDLRSFPCAYSKQNIGIEVSRNIPRWLTSKFWYGWETIQRERREVLDSN